MLDFTSALYLGFRHASSSLSPWAQLTAGVPAALEEPEAAREAARRLAGLQGCEAAVLSTSTLHLFWDFFGILGHQEAALYVEADIYPVARWGVERAASLGGAVRYFPNHSPRSLEARLSKSPPGRRVVVVADGICTRCGTAAPLREYLELVRTLGGLLVLDDTQALGLLGRSPARHPPYGLGGRGSLTFAGFGAAGESARDVLLVSSLAKAFGAPLAVLAGSRAVVQSFASASQTRLHCSPPSLANIQAALHALRLNEKAGDTLRRKLAGNILTFQEAAATAGLSVIGGWFPLQTVRLASKSDPQRTYRRLLDQGVRGLLHQSKTGAQPELSFILTARHTLPQIKRLVGLLAQAPEKRTQVFARPFFSGLGTGGWNHEP